MKNQLLRAVLTLTLAVATLPGCSATRQAAAVSTTATVANAVTAGASLLPAVLTADVRALLAKHPQARPYLVSVANGLESIANAENKLPAPDSAANTLLQWTELIPQVGSYVSDFEALYKLYYPTIAPTAAALSELAELIRADAA